MIERLQARFNCSSDFRETGDGNMHRDRQTLDNASPQDFC